MEQEVIGQRCRVRNTVGRRQAHCEIRQTWDLDLFKAKANCQGKVKPGGGRGWNQERSKYVDRCWLVLQVRADTWSEGSTPSSRNWSGSQVWGPSGPSREPAARWRLVPSPCLHLSIWLLGALVELGDGLLSVHLEF